MPKVPEPCVKLIPGQHVIFEYPNGGSATGVVEIQKWPDGIGDVVVINDGEYVWEPNTLVNLLSVQEIPKSSYPKGEWQQCVNCMRIQYPPEGKTLCEWLEESWTLELGTRCWACPICVERSDDKRIRKSKRGTK